MTNAVLNRNAVWSGLIVLFVVAVIYSSAITGGFLWDDDDHVSEVMPLRSLQGLEDIWLKPGSTCQYYPLTFTSFWVQYQLWQDNTFGYHAVNILLHAANAWLILLLLMRLQVKGAWVGALLFAVHPVTVMSVAWITELKNVQSGFFLLLAVHAFLGFMREDRGGGRVAARGLLVVVLFVLALLTKTASVILPLGLLLLVWWKDGRVQWQVGGLLVLLLVVGTLAGLGTLQLEKTFVGASGQEFDLTLLDRILVSARAFWFYAGKILWPAGLAFIYPRWTVDAGSPVQYIPVLALIVSVAWLAIQRKSYGRGPVALAVYFFVASSALIIFQAIYMTRYTFVSDHWLYYATLGVLPFGGSYLFRRAGTGLGENGVSALFAALLILLSWMSWQRGHVYKDSGTLWRDTLAKNPASWMAHSNYGYELARHGDHQQALAHYQESVALKPDLANAYNNMGLSLRAMKRYGDAAASYVKALSIEPEHVESMNNLALLLMGEGKSDEARELLTRALTIREEYAEPYNTLGMLLNAEGDAEGALQSFEDATERDRYHINAFNNLAATQLSLGDAEESLDTYRRALLLDRRNPTVHYNMALAQRRIGNVEEAESHFRAAIREDPAFGVAYAELGGLLFSEKRYSEAVGVLTTGLEMSPGHAVIQSNLGSVLLIMGDVSGAKHYLSEALRLNPNDVSAKRNLQIANQQEQK